MAFRSDKPLQDVTGRYLTKALFEELTIREIAERYPPMCTIKEAHDLYMEIGDITEYEFAKALLYSDNTNFWDHWQRLLNTEDFLVYLRKWREELEVKLRSKAIKELITNSTTDKGAASAKWLAEKGWLNNPNDRKAGRPTKNEVEKERKIQAQVNEELVADMERLGITH